MKKRRVTLFAVGSNFVLFMSLVLQCMSFPLERKEGRKEGRNKTGKLKNLNGEFDERIHLISEKENHKSKVNIWKQRIL